MLQLSTHYIATKRGQQSAVSRLVICCGPPQAASLVYHLYLFCEHLAGDPFADNSWATALRLHGAFVFDLDLL
jgi:hypothetical protein